jgi:N-acylneuraminate cytidylyltransferase
MGKKNLVIIPLRANSIRLPNKNTMELDGIPLFLHSVNYAKENAEFINEIVVITNDDKVKEIAKEHKITIIDRPKNISGEFEPTITALQYVLNTIDKDFENIILLQATNPLRPKKLLAEALSIFKNQGCASLMTVTKNKKKLGKIKNSLFKTYNYQFGQRSQDLDPLFFENGLLYIISAKMIRKGEIMNENTFPMIIEHSYSIIDIDTKEDFELANYYFNKIKHG